MLLGVCLFFGLGVLVFLVRVLVVIFWLICVVVFVIFVLRMMG